jgi:hypothetical protein
MTEEQEVMERIDLPTFCCRSTNKEILAQTHMSEFFICSVSNTIFAILLFQNCLQTTVWETVA